MSLSAPCILVSVLLAQTTLEPNPNLTPDAVVKIVVTALRSYNAPIPNAGIYTTYQFASPANRAVTGPYGHFLGAVKNTDFAPLLKDDPSEFGPVLINNNDAEQTVTVHMPQGRDVGFTFNLSRQQSGVHRGCWMVDGVGRSLHP